jgi:hypothetical protein
MTSFCAARTVIVYDQAAGQDQEVLLRGARLVNAMGRAGRAGKETEGWIVLVRAAQPTEQDFRDLNPDAEELAVTSALDTALEEFAALEQALRDDQDAVFTAAAGLAADFVSFVWLILTINEEAGADTSQINVTTIVDTTLAAAQSPQTRAVLLRVAQAVHVSYQRKPGNSAPLGPHRNLDRLRPHHRRTSPRPRLRLHPRSLELQSPPIGHRPHGGGD